jgi:hypothetical protein
MHVNELQAFTHGSFMARFINVWVAISLNFLEFD